MPSAAHTATAKYQSKLRPRRFFLPQLTVLGRQGTQFRELNDFTHIGRLRTGQKSLELHLTWQALRLGVSGAWNRSIHHPFPQSDATTGGNWTFIFISLPDLVEPFTQASMPIHSQEINWRQRIIDQRGFSGEMESALGVSGAHV
jgi:hypothetical protein